MATILVRQDIGDGGVSEHDFARQVAAAADDGELRLVINSFGGSVFSALSMMATLSRFDGYKVAEVEGIAASAATFLAMACDAIEMHEPAFFMVHNSHGAAIGNHADLTKQAATLRQIDQTIAGIYSRRSGGSVQAWLDAMSQESWLTAGEMHSLGLASVIPSHRQNTHPKASQAAASVANRSVRAQSVVNRLTGSASTARPLAPSVAAALAPYQARIDEIEREMLLHERRENRRLILANANSPRQARNYLGWS